MKTSNKTLGRSRFCAGVASTVVGVAMLASPAFAQDAEDEEAGSDIIVTGSRIPQPNIEGISPITTVNAQEIKAQGVVRVENLVNALPQAFAEYGSNDSNGALGIATANLRGLGSNRTLVLVNGRRLVPGNPTSVLGASPDLNNIPAALVKRVDVLTGGASSVYGADAVGGVVNFIMDTEFTGFKVDAQYSFYQHNNNTNNGMRAALAGRNFPTPVGNVADGGAVDATATLGAAFDDGRGHVVAYAGYRKLNAVTQDRRDYSACATQARTPAQAGTNPPGGTPGAPLFFCGGSATSANGTFIVWDNGTSTFYQIGANRTLTPGFTPYNFAPTNYYQRPDERYTAGFFAKYEISDALRPYLEGMFMDDRSLAQIAPSGNFGNTLSINCDNPLLSAQQLTILCDAENLIDTTGTPMGSPQSNGVLAVFTDPTTGAVYNRGFAQILRRNVEGGPRISDLQHTSYRIVAGMNGDLGKGFSYDAFYQYGRTNYNQTYYNDFSITRIGRAIDIVDDPTQPGIQPVCRSTLGANPLDANCVPWDIFATGQVTPAAINYVQTPGFQRGQTSQQIAGVSFTGLLGEHGVKLPWTDNGVAVNVGFEYRKDSLELRADTAFQTGDLAGQGAPTLDTQGSYNVKEFFGELRVPIVDEGFVHQLAFEAGYRHSSYSVGGGNFSTGTWKIAGELAPVKDIRFRVAYNRAVRAPNIQELFAPNIVALNGNGDPCAGAAILGSDNVARTGGNPANTDGYTAAQCANTGVTAAQFGNIAGNPAGQYNGFVGGNANLTPEVAKTLTAGVVVQPSFIPKLALTVDYFDIKIRNLVSQIGQDTILDTCARTGDATFCSLINRDQFGSLWRTNQGFVVDTTQNIGGLSTKGIDVGLSYSTEIGSAGTLAFNMNGTYLMDLKTDDGVNTPETPIYDCSGYYGLICGTPNPKWRHRARLTFTTPSGVGISAQWRYFNKVDLDRTSANASLTNANSAPQNLRIGSQSYFDLTASVAIADKYTFRLGVNNILDKEPPIIGSNGTSAVINACPSVFCNGNTFPNVYDALGRYIFAGVTLDF